MGFRISTNVQSLASQRTLNSTRESQNRSLEKLAAGERITRAGDDAAGLAISEKFKAEIRSLKQADRNANDGISLIQTAEGGMNEIQNILIRLRELSMQAASDTVGDIERSFSNKEFQSLVGEVGRIAKVTNYNGKSLLDGSMEPLEFQVGTKNNPYEDRLIFDTHGASATTEKLGIAEMSVATKAQAQDNLGKVDEAIRILNDGRAGFGALQNRLQATVNNLQVAYENLSAANSRIRDVDVAQESSELTKRNILMQAGTAMLAQANSNGMTALKLIA